MGHRVPDDVTPASTGQYGQLLPGGKCKPSLLSLWLSISHQLSGWYSQLSGILAFTMLSPYGIRGSSIGSGGGSAPVPEQRGQSTTSWTCNRWTLPSTSVTLSTSTVHWPSHQRHSAGSSGGSVGGWGNRVVMVTLPFFYVVVHKQVFKYLIADDGEDTE